MGYEKYIREVGCKILHSNNNIWEKEKNNFDAMYPIKVISSVELHNQRLCLLLLETLVQEYLK